MTGVLALVGGGEFTDACADLDKHLLEASGGDEVLVLPTAAAFEHPDRVVARAEAHFGAMGARVSVCPVLRRPDAERSEHGSGLHDARFVYVADGSPLHLRSVLKDSALFSALTDAWKRGAVVAASGAGATLVCDPMVDPRGGAYTVGLGWVRDLAVFPYHGTAADHMKERSIDLLPRTAVLAGVDEATALVRDPNGSWRADGAGEVTLFSRDGETGRYRAEPVPDLDGR